MIKIATLPSYFHPVKVEFPTDDGKKKTVEFQAQFKRLSQQEIEEQQEALTSGALGDRGVIDQVMIGWKGVADEDGVPVEFNESNLASLLSMFPTQPSIVRAYFDSLKNVAKKI